MFSKYPSGVTASKVFHFYISIPHTVPKIGSFISFDASKLISYEPSGPPTKILRSEQIIVVTLLTFVSI